MKHKSVMIFQAASNGDATMVKHILDLHPELATSINEQGWSALHLAARFGHIDVLKVMLDRGADLSLASNNQIEAQPLHAAVAGNQPEMVKLLLDAGADVNATQMLGWTALHGAAQQEHLEIVKTLLAAGADHSLKTDAGKTAREIAIENDHNDIAELLLK